MNNFTVILESYSYNHVSPKGKGHVRRGRTAKGNVGPLSRVPAVAHAAHTKKAVLIEHFITEMSFVDVFNTIVFIAFTICYAYQLFYVANVLMTKPRILEARKNHRYAVMIAARNERAVIGNLIHSIKVQNYPSELIDVFVVADNCSDDTAEVARKAGAIVFKRFNDELVGKGYALDFCLKAIRAQYADRAYEAYFVFDADNVLDRNYFREMNKTFDNGAKASTSYRNSKNYDSNWISAGYAVWFIREAKFLSQARLNLNTSCAISGTGFFIASDVLERAGGWNWHLLTEDIEFSAASIIDGVRISYCPTAVLYDEQPITFRDSWNQRMRWAKGFYQVFGRYGADLAKGIFTQSKGHRFACYDMLMTISPAMLLTVFSVSFNSVIVILGAMGVMTVDDAISSSLSSIAFCLMNYVAFMFLFGMLTTIVEWKSFHAAPRRKILHMLTFPLFMLTYIPIAIIALVKKAEWKPIRHSIAVSIEDIGEAGHASALVR